MYTPDIVLNINTMFDDEVGDIEFNNELTEDNLELMNEEIGEFPVDDQANHFLLRRYTDEPIRDPNNPLYLDYLMCRLQFIYDYSFFLWRGNQRMFLEEVHLQNYFTMNNGYGYHLMCYMRHEDDYREVRQMYQMDIEWRNYLWFRDRDGNEFLFMDYVLGL
jgi:Fe-S oxidoreductase